MHKLRDAPGDSEADLRARLQRIAGKKKVYVLGLGNVDRADDGAGVLVALELKKRFPDQSFSEHDGVEGTVLDIAEKDEQSVVFFVDAAELRLGPGSTKVVMREDIKETEITTNRVAVALMASILEAHGKGSSVICIQPSTIKFQGDISEPVRMAIDNLVSAMAHVMSRARDSPS